MASLSSIITTTFFFLNAFTLFPTHSQARHPTSLNHHSSTPSTSLILPLTPSKTSLPPPKKQPIQTASSMDMMEPLRGVRDGYLIPLNLGTPPQLVQVYMDTGSDLTWVPCGNFTFDCIDCDDYYKSTLNPKSFGSFTPSLSSTSYRDMCGSRFCYDVHSSESYLDPCVVSGCSLGTLLKSTCSRPCPSFAYTYGAGGVVTGSLTRDTLRVHVNNNDTTSREVQKFCFGCVGSTYHEPIGIAGFGRGPLSLPSQLGLDGKGFSHCFLPFKYANNPNVSSTLLLGEASLLFREGMQFTPMLNSSMYPNYYYVGMEAITILATTAATVVNTSTIVGPEVPSKMREFDSRGNGGMLIDSGTTYTHLPEPFYSELLSMLGSVIGYPRAGDVEEKVGFDLCYRVPIVGGFPGVTFHFMNNASVVVGEENLFQAVEAAKNGTVVKCLMMESMEEEEEGGGPAGVFGNFQQQNVEVVYDLDKGRIGFRAMDCASQGLFHQK
ncbi:Probable aspartyl protease At4g16563 [Linum perenne]